MTHAFTFGSHPRARRLWTWRCSCGEHCRGRLMGTTMDWLPFAEAAERAQVHLVAVGAEVGRGAAVNNEVRLTITASDRPDLVGTTWATDDEGNHYTVDGLSFHRLRDVNTLRCKRWHDGTEPWTGADWATAMGGECGEALNVVKKLRRAECGVPAPADPDRAELLDMLGAELADTVIYLDLLADFYGVDLAAAIVAKFNAVSERQGFPERLP